MFRKTLNLVVLAVFALPLTALAQDDDGDDMDAASPRATLVISSWKCDFRHMGDIVASMDSVARPVYQGMVDEGLIRSWGMFLHDWADDWNVNFYTVTDDKASFFEAWTEAGRRINAIVGDDAANPVLEYCTEHKDGIYTLGPRTQDSDSDDG